VRVPLAVAFRLSLAKLFIDQALPSAGLSGTLVAARALEQRGVARAVVMAAMVIDGVAYYGAYVLALLAALLVAAPSGNARLLFLPAALFLALFSVAFAAAALAIAGRSSPRLGNLARIPLVGRVAALLGQSDPGLVRSPALLFRCVGLQLAVVLLDAATVWVLVHALGAAAPPLRVYGSYMASSLLRTISIVPGGLGVFEAASVITLQQAGVSIPVALGATLLFRGLSFWLPMAPGLWFTRQFRRPVPAPR
jgi:Mg2+-importing ATPase